MRLAFWNIDGRDANVPLLAASGTLDVMGVAEAREPHGIESRLRALDPGWRWVAGTGDRTTVFVRGVHCEPLLGSGSYWSVVALEPRGRPSLTMVIVHLRSRRFATPTDIGLDCVGLRADIVEIERLVGHRRTILLGDFNLDPYDVGLCDQRSLLAVMDRRLAVRLDERAGTREAVFYNPMWSRMGDASDGPPGTYYRSRDDHHDYFFHTFDQVMVRPLLIGTLGRVTVPRRVHGVDLVSTSDLPRRGVASDHLPIIVELT